MNWGAVCYTPGPQIVQVISQKKNGKIWCIPVSPQKSVKSKPDKYLVWLLLLRFFGLALMFLTVFFQDRILCPITYKSGFM